MSHRYCVQARLPQGVCCVRKYSVPHRINVGAGLARDGAVSVTLLAECPTAIAGKHGSHRGFAAFANIVFLTESMWEPGLPAMGPCQSPSLLNDPPLSRANPVPTGDLLRSQIVFHTESM